MQGNRLTILSILICNALLAIALSLLLQLIREGDKLAPGYLAFVMAGLCCSVGSAMGMGFFAATGRSPWQGIIVGAAAVYGLIIVYGIAFGMVTMMFGLEQSQLDRGLGMIHYPENTLRQGSRCV